MTRWATFDCYGTLIDWNGGIRAELARVFGNERADEQLRRYHELEPELEADGSRSYRDVMTEAMRQLGAPAGEEAGLADSLPRWQPFAEVRASLEDVRRRGWMLAILSNSDPDMIEASKRLLGVPFDETVVAGEIGSYKPALGHWREFSARTAADPDRHVHVGASLFHDVAPAGELGLPTVWINRLGEQADWLQRAQIGSARPRPAQVVGDLSPDNFVHPTVELPDLSGLGDVLDDLVRE